MSTTLITLPIGMHEDRDAEVTLPQHGASPGIRGHVGGRHLSDLYQLEMLGIKEGKAIFLVSCYFWKIIENGFIIK